MNPSDTQVFEINEYLVTFLPDRRKLFYNPDLIDCFGRSINESFSQSNIKPCGMKHILPSASAKEMFIGQQKFWENHRIIPKIDNQGIITGTNLMLNMYMIYKQNILIVNDIDKIK